MVLQVPTDERHAAIASALSKIQEGKSLRAIAADHGIAVSTLHRWLLGEVPDEYRYLQQQGLIARVVDADAELDAARDHVAVAKAREAARFFRWDLERRLPALFGPKQEVTGPGGGPLQVMDVSELARRIAYLTAAARLDSVTASKSAEGESNTASPLQAAQQQLLSVEGPHESEP